MALTQSDRVKKKNLYHYQAFDGNNRCLLLWRLISRAEKKRENHKKITESEHNDNNGPCTMYMALYDTTSRNEHKKNNNNNNNKKNEERIKRAHKSHQENHLVKKKNGIVDLMCTLFFLSFSSIRDDSIWTCAYVLHEFAAGSRVFYHEHCFKQKQKFNKKPEILHKITKLFELCI